jgi:hypothetical protein
MVTGVNCYGHFVSSADDQVRASQLAINDQWKWEAAQREEQAAKRSAKLAEFRKLLAIGTMTNCGRVVASTVHWLKC